MADPKTTGSEWSEAYALAISHQDSHSMLYLLGLNSWPPLTRMYGDLVEDLTLICTLLSKRPMVGYLIARRLGLEREKTQVLLSVLEEKGYVRAVGVHLEVNKNVFGASQIQLPGPVKSTHATEFSTYTSTNTEAADTAAVLSQLWRVLNTDIAFKRPSNTKNSSVSAADANAHTSDVLSQLWRVLNTDIALKLPSSTKQGAQGAEPVKEAEPADETADVMGQLWRVLNTEIAFKRQSNAPPNSESEEDASSEVADVMSQLWRVLNTEIAFKRRSNPNADSKSATDTGREAADRLSQLWRVLHTEIALKKQSNPGDESDTGTDTTGEASDRLSQLWRILNAEITVTLPPEGKK